jgi:hypothetical protein
MRPLLLAALLLLAACGTPAATAVPTPVPTATRAPTATVAPTPTLTGLQATGTAIAARQRATLEAARTGACQTIAGLYANVGRTFDRFAAARDPALADIDLHIVLFGNTDPDLSRASQQRFALYKGVLRDCIAP